MVKTSFILMALVAATAMGRQLDSEPRIEKEYLEFVSRNNKQLERKGKYEKRLKTFKENDDFIKAVNKKADEKQDKNALRLDHNVTSDLDQQEFFENYLGAVPPSEPEIEADRAAHEWQPPTLGNEELPASYDHVALGHMTNVRNQGGCGSCWAFTANTTYEGTIGAKRGKRWANISEQHLVDCTSNTEANNAQFGRTYGQGGCRGGWMSGAW